MKDVKYFSLYESYDKIKKSLEEHVSYTEDINKVWIDENFLTATYFVRNQQMKADEGMGEQDPQPMIFTLNNQNDSVDTYSVMSLDFLNEYEIKEDNEIIDDVKAPNLGDGNPGDKKPRPEENGDLNNQSRIFVENDNSSKIIEGQELTKFSKDYEIEPSIMTFSLYEIGSDSEENTENEEDASYTAGTKNFKVKYKSYEFDVEPENYQLIDPTNELPLIDKPFSSLTFTVNEGKLSTDSMLMFWYLSGDSLIYDGYVYLSECALYNENKYKLTQKWTEYLNKWIKQGDDYFVAIVDNSAIEQYYTMKNASFTIDEIYTMNVEMYEEALYTLKILSNNFPMNLITKVVINGEVQENVQSYYQVYGNGNFTVDIYFSTRRLNCFENMFNGCEMLRTVDFSNFTMKPIYATSTMGMFAGCHSLTKLISLERLNTLHVIDMRGMFYQCFQLNADYGYGDTINQEILDDEITTFDATALKVDNVKMMDSMFEKCHFRHINTSTWNTNNLISAEYMFSSFELIDLDFSNWNMSNMNETFYNIIGYECQNLTEILWTCEVPKFENDNTNEEQQPSLMLIDDSGYYGYGSVAYNKGTLIYNPNYFDPMLLQQYIYSGWNCKSYGDYFDITLTLVENGKTLTEGIFLIDGYEMIFDADTNLWYGQVKAEKFDFELIYNDYIVNVNILDTIIFFGDNNNSYEGLNIICVYDTPNPYIAHKLINPNSIRDMQVMLIDGKQVELFPIKTFNEIGEHTVSFMFNQYNNSNRLDRMAVQDTGSLSNLFTSCHFLKEVTFKNNIILPEYSSMYETFYDCINLQKVIFEEGFDSTNLYYMERTFYKCGMKEYNVIGLDTSNVISYYECFRNSKIEYMDFRKIQFNKEATSSYMFQDSSLNHIYISNEMGDLNTGNTYNMFYGLSEEGICEYNCNYDVSKVISIIPQTWNIECIPVNVTIKLILIKEGEVITELTENEILTITDNKISGSYDLEQGCWIFNYMAYDVFDDVYLNDTYIGYVSNQKTVKQYAFIGDCSSYTGYSFQSTFVTTTDSEYVIFNKSQQKNMISVILDGYPIKGNIAYIYTNLYNDVDYIATFTNGKAINNDGSEISVSGYELSDYIPISNSTTIMWHNGDQSGYSKLIEYDENKNVLDYWTCNNATRTITLGGNTNTKYMRIALKTSVKDNVYLIDETNQKYLFRGNDVEIKGVNENIGETHTVQYIFDVEENNSMANLFDGCSGLTYIQFNENFDTSNVEYMNSLFYNCKGLKDLNITSLKTDNAKAISSMFAMCSGLTTIDVSHFNTEKCDNISDMFPYTNVETLDLSNFKTSNVTTLSMMFRYNTNLKTIIGLDKWDMSNVTNMTYVFQGCTSLSQETIESIFKWNVSKVIDMGYMFQNCRTMTYFTFKDWDTQSLLSSPAMFAGAYNVNVEFGDEFKAPQTIDSMFNNIGNVEIDLSNWNFNSTYYKISNMYQLFRDCSNLEKITFGEQWTDIRNITMQRCFYGCSKLKEINGIEYIGSTYSYTNSSNGMFTETFRGCSSLETIDLSSWSETMNSKDSGKYCGTMFYGCSKLKNINLSGWDKFTLHNIDNMFNGCSSLTSTDDIIGLNTLNTSNSTIMNAMFANCSNLIKVDISNLDTSKITTMSSMYQNCNSLETVKMNSNINSLTNVSNMFSGIGTKGMLEYNCNYDYSKIINVLPINWTTFCPNKELISKIILLVDNSEVISLNENDVFTYNGINGTYNSEGGYWEFVHTPISPNSVVIYNDEVMNIFTSEKIEWFIVGGANARATFSTNANHNVKVTHDKTYISRMIIDGNNVTVSTNYTFPTAGMHEVIYVYDKENINTFSELYRECDQLVSFEMLNFNTTNKITSTFGMFYKDRNITTIDLNKVDTSEVTNMQDTFAFCNKLTKLNISSWNTENVTNMWGLFYENVIIPYIDLSNFNTSKVTTMGNMFSYCRKLTNVPTTNFDTSKVTNMSNMFRENNLIKEFDISNFDMSNVTTIDTMFYSCASLKSIIIDSDVKSNVNVGNFMTGNIPVGGVLYYNCEKECTKLLSAIPGSWVAFCPNTEITTNVVLVVDNNEISSLNDTDVFTVNGVNGIYDETNKYWSFTHTPLNAFSEIVYNDNMLEIISDDSSVQYMYVGSISEDTINLSQTFTTTAVNQNLKVINSKSKIKAQFIDGKQIYKSTYHTFDEIGEHIVEYVMDVDNMTSYYSLFQNCSSMVSVDMSNMGGTKVSDMSYMFDGCNKLTSFNFNGLDTSNVTNMQYMFQNCNVIPSIDLSMIDTSRVTNMGWIFQYCRNCERFKLDGKFTTSAVTNMQSFFTDCEKLDLNDVAQLDTRNVTNMSYMFSENNTLTELNNFNLDTRNVTTMARMFQNCNKLTNVSMLLFDTIQVTNMEYMFVNCSSLQTVDLSTFKVNNLSQTNGMFEGCSKLTSVNLSSFETNSITNMHSMFKNCSSLQTVDLSAFDTSKVTQMYNMFYNCSGLTSIDLRTFDTSNVTNMNEMFFNAVSLTNVKMNSSISKASVNNIFNNIKTNGTLEYTCGYDYSKIIAKLPSTWNSVCLEFTNSIKLFVNGVEITSLNDTDVFTVNGVNGVYDSESQNWKFTHTPSELTCKLIYNDNELDIISNTTKEQYAIIGNMSDDICNLTQKVVTTKANQNVKLINNTKFVKSMTINGNYVLPKTHNTFEEIGEYEIKYVLDDSYTNLSYMFDGCGNVTSFTFNNFDTSNVTSIARMFQNCSGLTSLDLSMLDTSNVTRMVYTFQGCKKCSTFTLNDKFTTSAVTTMSGMFADCDKLQSSDLTILDTSNVTNMSYMFQNCNELTSLDLSTFDTRNVTNFAYMFQNCNNLKTLNVSTFDTSNANNMPYMFANCGKLSSLDISNFDTSNITNMEGMFQGCSSLTTIDVSMLNTNNVTNISRMFQNCSNLTTLDLTTFDTRNVTNMSYLFSNCGKLTTFDTTVGVINTDKVTNMEGMFQGCNSFATFDLSILNTSNVTNMAGMFQSCNFTEFDFSVLNTTKVTNISSMFASCSKLTTIDFTTLDTRKIISMNNLFQNCTSLTNLDLSTFDTSSVTNMTNMFQNCNKLTSLDLSTFDTSSVTSMEGMFSGCSVISEIVFDKELWNTSNVTNMKNVFNSCSGLTSIDTSVFNTSNVTNMHGLFSRCTSLTEVDLSSWNTDKLTNMEYTFDYCQSMESIDLSSFNLSNVTTMLELFINSTNLKHIKMNGSVAKVTNVNNMFNGITTDGVFEYDCSHDYSKIIAKLPSTWTTQCIE